MTKRKQRSRAAAIHAAPKAKSASAARPARSDASPPTAAMPETGSIWQPRDVSVAIAIAMLASLAVYHRGLEFPFSLDDYTYLYPASGVEPSEFSLRRLVGTTLFYKIGFRVFGVESPTPWHLFNFALHSANAVWVYALARRFGARRDAAWLAVGLFAASPVAFATLYWVACEQELSSAFFVLAATWVALRDDRWRWASLALFAIAVLCKESVLAAPLVLPFRIGRKALGLASAQLAVGAALFVGSGLHERMFVFDASMPYATNYGQGVFANLATAIVWLVTPWRAYPDRVSGGDPAMLPWAAGIAFGAVIVLLLVRRGSVKLLIRPAIIASAWFVALLMPVLPLFQHFFAYYLYVPQIGFVVLFSSALLGAGSLVWRRPQSVRSTRAMRLAAAVVALIGCGVFAHRNARTHETLMVPGSTALHDSVLRYGVVSGALLEYVRDQDFPSTTRRIAFLLVEPEPGKPRPVIGTERPGKRRIRTIPVQNVLSGDKFFRLHFPELDEGRMIKNITEEHEKDTAFVLVHGLSSFERVPNVAMAYSVASYGHLLQDRYDEAQQHALRSLHLGSREAINYLVVAGVAATKGRVAAAESLVARVQTLHDTQNLDEAIATVQRLIQEQRDAAR